MGRKRLFTLAGITAAGLAAWVAAPALSLAPYAPEPVDFEQALPSAERVSGLTKASALRAAAAQPAFIAEPAEGAVRWISPPVQAPKRFDVVGLIGSRRAVEFRTKRPAEPWTEWHEVDSGDPVWAGASTWVQVRSRGARPRGTLHYVNVSGGETSASGVLATMRGAIHSAFAGVAATPRALAETIDVSTAPPRPTIKMRAEWDPGNDCKPKRKASYGKMKAAVIHHTVDTNAYSAEQAKQIVLGICRFHRFGNRWDDIGYNALVDRFGILYEGRAGGLEKAVIGAHTQGFNGLTTALASIGDHRSSPIEAAAIEPIEKYLAWKLFTVHGKHAKGKVKIVSGGGSQNRWKKGKKVKVARVTFHSKLGSTECPGGAGRSQVKYTIVSGTEDKIVNGSSSSSSSGSGGAAPAPAPGP